MRRFRQAKIIATLGPASSSEEVIESLFRAGADVFRLNFSYGTHDDHRARLDTIRALAKQLRRPIGILADLQGPKLRIGTFTGGKAALSAGQTFRLDLLDAPGSPERVGLPHPEIFAALKSGTDLLLDDGRIRLSVTQVTPEFAETEVVTDGVLSDRKGVNVPGVALDISPLTKKDRADLAFALGLWVDWVALSFVQHPEDVSEIRKLVDGAVGIVAKLEKPGALDHLDAIIELSDAVMVARGDLGVEIPPERVPLAQKRIIAAARQVAQTLKAQAIATFTFSGSTTLRAARERPCVPILCLTPNVHVARRMTLAWGMHAVIDPGITSFTEAARRLRTRRRMPGADRRGTVRPRRNHQFPAHRLHRRGLIQKHERRPEGRLFRSARDKPGPRGSALARLEARVGLVDHADTPLATHHAAVFIPRFRGLQRVANLHDTHFQRLRQPDEARTIRSRHQAVNTSNRSKSRPGLFSAPTNWSHGSDRHGSHRCKAPPSGQPSARIRPRRSPPSGRSRARLATDRDIATNSTTRRRHSHR